ncbi:TPA: LPXTG cell wall anchor domain-containing protein [Streptococcus agalactiae]|nr:LPXTG cell wall anchor domain-containing protein [Streptococcus agalactiae]
MKKVKALALFSTAILATASTGVYADEVISDGTTSPSTEQVDPTPAPSSSEVTPGSESNIPTPSSSSSTEAPEGSKRGSETTETEPTQPATEPEKSTETPSEQPGEVEVPTTDGGKATVVPDTSVPTNNPNITAETAQNAGASQVGTTSTITGQVVRDVTRSNPVTLYNGASLVDIRDGLVTLSTGEKVAPEVVGVKSNADGTYTAKTIQGDTVTLPHTGEKNSTVLSVVGALILSVLGFGLKKRKNQEI